MTGVQTCSLPICDKLDNPYGIYIEEDEQELWIIDDGTQINKYTLDGELKHIIKLPFKSVDLRKHDEKFFYYTARIKNTVNSYILNYNEKEGDIREYIPVNWNIKRHGNITSDVFAKTDSGLYFLLPANDTIYYYNENKVFPYVRLNFEGEYFTETSYPDKGFTDKEYSELIINKEYVLGLDCFTGLSDKLMFYTWGKYEKIYIYNLKTKTLNSCNGLIDNIKPSGFHKKIQG